MGNLLKIEFFIQKKFAKSFIIALMFMTAIFIVNGGSQSIYIMGSFMIFYLIVSTIELSKRNEFQIYLSSLPIKKSTYILSKYTSALIYIIFINILTYIMYRLVSIIIPPSMEVNTAVIILTISIELLYVSILEPIFITINYKYYKIANIIAVVSIVIISNILFSILIDGYLNGDFTDVISGNILLNPNPIFLAIGVILFIISFMISNIIYNRMDVK